MATDPARIVDALKGHDGWVDARYLADALGVTTRTVRNLVHRVNDGRATPLIESSYRGYRIKPGEAGASAGSEDHRPQVKRADAILRRLISLNEPISVYDLSDEFYVSDSTIEADLRRVRESLGLHDLTLTRSRDLVQLEGSEANKRKLIGQLLSAEGAGGFSTLAGQGIVVEGCDVGSIANMVRASFAKHDLLYDDFGLNNVVLHLAIMAGRMSHGMQMPDDGSSHKAQGTPAYQASCDICQSLGTSLGLNIPEGEIGYLALVIASNSRTRDYSFARSTDISNLIDERDIELTQQATKALEHAYYLEPFDEDFVMRVAVHVHSLLQRLEGNVGSHNPLLAQIKESYPLVYDMAVFFARTISQSAQVPLSEDEIAFLAFHIGAYLEKNGPGSDLASAIFLYMDYHDMHQITLERIREEFKSSLSVVAVVQVSEFHAVEAPVDIVISPVEVPVAEPAKLVLLPLLPKERDLQALRAAVDAQLARRRSREAVSLINRFLTPELFMHNLHAPDATSMIRTLTADCTAKRFANEGFADEVLAREAMSPTSFANRLALPHSMHASANRSFLSVVTNDQPMAWGPHEVNLILLLGISPGDRKEFRVLFDSLTEVLSDAANVMRLARCATFDELTRQLNEMVSR
jgi:lichenan operon transcriptional antiterminator